MGGTAAGGASNTGGSTNSGGSTSTGGTQQAGSVTAASGGNTVVGGTTASGGSTRTGGTTGTGGNTGAGGTGTSGGNASTGGATGTGGSTTSTTVPLLPPPNPCSNQFTSQGCRKGQASSTCGGICANDYGGTAANVCQGGSNGVPVNYACPQFMLYSDALNQAVIADGFGDKLNYAVVGHDMDGGSGGVDSGLPDACCQCYQLVFDYPKENQVWVDPDHTPGTSAINIPKPLVVQSFNTATNGPDDFDIYMGAGGFGANNGCYVSGGTCPGGPCMYSGYPTQDGGMVKAVGNTFQNPWPDPCKTSVTNWVTQATLTSPACANAVTTACNQITSPNASIQTQTIRSCVQSNGVKADDTGQIPGDYHVNWYIWVKRVECPTSLTNITGCKLASQALPKPDPNVATVPQAKAAGFLQKSGSGSNFSTTQMQDCCMATCSWSNNVKGTTVNGYNSFYSCDKDGVPWTTAVTRTQ